ncbi:MAG: extracellular solute-binding protein [Oscillospiraceae bacterium]|nr:extracellular solute-binding protein [Oscillospiraceae bacterium]
MKKISIILVCAMLLFSLAACASNDNPGTPPPAGGDDNQTQTGGNDTSGGGGTDTPPAAGVIEITIPHYKVGANVGALFFLPQVDRFNAKYEGVYKINIEEVPQDDYADKIQQLVQQGMAPALIEGGPQTWLEEVVIPEGMFYDLSTFLAGAPDIADFFLPENIAHNSRSGKLFSLTYPVVRPMTIFYNGDMFSPSKSFAELSWDDVISELGDNKIAFMTSENAWTTMLTLSSMIAAEPGGAELLTNGVVDKITDFSHPAIVNAMTKLQTLLQNHASSNTIGAAYADAANSFMSMNSALIANGPWMVGDFMPDSEDKWSNGFNGDMVRGDVLPGNVGLANVLGYGWWIPSSVPQEQAEAAWAFIAFMMSADELEQYMLAEGGTAPRVPVNDAFLAARADNRILDELINAVNANTIFAPAFADAIPSSVADPEFGKLLPKLIDGSLTAAEFCDELTRIAAETAN